jgi:hypothetical protein
LGRTDVSWVRMGMDQEGGASIPGEPSGEDTSRREEAGFGGRDGHFMGEGMKWSLHG